MELNSPEQRKRKIRSECDEFEFNENCLFCGRGAKIVTKKNGSEVYSVRTLEFQKTINDFCMKRQDDWGEDVLCRLEFARELPAVEAIIRNAAPISRLDVAFHCSTKSKPVL